MKLYQKGYRFEKHVRADIEKRLRAHQVQHYHIMESRGSHGIADLKVEFHGRVFNVQCKAGYISTPSKRRLILYALRNYGIKMFIATKSNKHRGEVMYYPDLDAYIDMVK
jgi:hypothetical protein